MSEFTKGPWVIVPGDEWTLDVATIEPKPETMDGVNYWTVASCNGRRHEARANLALIAAAPDLLEALEAAMAFIESHAADPDLTADMWAKYAALQALNPAGVIALARGEA